MWKVKISHKKEAPKINKQRGKGENSFPSSLVGTAIFYSYNRNISTFEKHQNGWNS